MKKVSATLAAILLTSCASIPETSNGLVSTTDVKDSKCYSQEQAEVSKKVKDFLEYCYRVKTIEIPVAGIMLPLTSEFQVVEESDEIRKRYSVRSRYGFGITVDIKPGNDSCKTQVDMYALRNHLKEKFERIDDAIKNNNPSCGVV